MGVCRHAGGCSRIDAEAIAEYVGNGGLIKHEDLDSVRNKHINQSAASEAVAASVDTIPLTVNYSAEDLNPDTDSTATSNIQRNGDSISTDGRVHVPNGLPFDSLFDQTLLKFTNISELISVDSVHSGMLTELTYTIGLKRSNLIQEFISEIKKLNGNNKVTLIAGYNNTNL